MGSKNVACLNFGVETAERIGLNGGNSFLTDLRTLADP